MTRIECPECGQENPEQARFCLNCGTKLAAVCPQCQASLLPQARFCSECGAEVGEAPPAARLESALQRLIPKEYAERLQASRGQVGRERRTVTILFCDVKGSTAMAGGLDPEDWMEIMDGAFDVLIEPIYRHEGTLARLMGDAVLAFFGAPIAHEDDPERACRAALAIKEGVQAYAAQLEAERGVTGFNVRVGIHTGLVVVGEVGSDLRVEYTAMGDAVNLASRLEQSAPPGGILVSHDTYRHIGGVFDALAQEPLAVKGKIEPVQTYLVQRAKPRAFRTSVRGVEGIETRMVGREAELKHLQEAFHAAVEDGELQVVTVSGEAGVGKSRLLYEFDTWSELLPERYYYFKGRASRETLSQPYGLLRDLIAFRFQIQDSDPVAAVRAKLEEGVAEALGTCKRSSEASHLIGHLVGFEFGKSGHLDRVQDDPQATRNQALGCLVDYYRGLAARLPVLMLLEDLHWADDSSLDALNEVVQALAEEPVMIACAARPVLFERRPHWGEGQAFHTRLDLQPLSRWDSRRLVAEILQKVEEVPGTLRDLVVSGAEGNPFFIEELIKMLVEDGVIVKGEETWQLDAARLVDVRVPPTLNGVLQARLDRLPPAERAILQEASVVGRLFWDLAVARIHESTAEGGERSEVLHSLSTLRSREMVFQRETSAFAGAEEYIFKHALLREVTYESVLRRLRRRYHGLVADWLLEQGGERAGEYTVLIADHLELAGRAGEAVDYLLQAGDRARGLHAHQEAIGAYRRALELLKVAEEYERAARTLMKLGLTYENAFDFRQARNAYNEGCEIWQQMEDVHPADLPPASLPLRVLQGELVSLDPASALDVDSSTVINQLLRGLVEGTPDMGILPDAAHDWEVLDRGLRYVFHLRDDLVWSDGMPVTAGDFQYAWMRLLAPCGLPGPCDCDASFLFDIRGARAYHRGHGRREDVGVQAVDDTTLVVELEGPTGYFLHLLAHCLSFAIPSHAVEAHGQAWTEVDKIVTNGPFRLVSWQKGEPLVLVRNPTYCGRRTGNVQQVEVLASGELSTALGLYEADRLDVLAHLDSLLHARQRFPGDYVSAPFLLTRFLGLHVGRPPFDDVRVRRAFALAVDRETLAGVVSGGLFFPAEGGFVPAGMPGHSPGIALPYDPDRARNLMAEAGYPGGEGFPEIEALTWIWSDACQHLHTQWREHLGVQVSWQILGLAAFMHRLIHGVPPEIGMSGWAADYPDPDTFLRQAFPWTATGWQNETYEGLIEEARRIPDQRRRIELYQRADRIAVEEAVIVPLVYGRKLRMAKPWVKRYPTSPLGNSFWKDVIIEPH